MTPRTFRVMAKAKIRQIREDRRVVDQIHAVQTARLMNIAGKYSVKEIQPESCMTFAWDDAEATNTNKFTKSEEEMMDEFDRSFDAWGRVNPE